MSTFNSWKFREYDVLLHCLYFSPFQSESRTISVSPIGEINLLKKAIYIRLKKTKKKRLRHTANEGKDRYR